ncbi:hypothetical protein GCM10027174_45990 [Salinifilum aidingensis]
MADDEAANARPTRALAREAVRSELSRAALELLLERGYEHVTVLDLAHAAGVSKSTFLRYLGSKDSAVLDAFRSESARIIDALHQRPASEDVWTALRRAIEPLLRHYHDTPERSLALSRLVLETPSLRVANLERQVELRDALAATIAERSPGRSEVQAEALAHAAVGCFHLAIEHWVRTGGQARLEDLLDDAFDAVRSTAQ